MAKDYSVIITPQAKMAMSGIGRMLGMIQGCASPTTAPEAYTNEPLHKAGDVVCVQDGGTSNLVTLLEDVKADQQTVIVKDTKTGKRRSVDTNYIQDYGTCI